jgi:hypothetical protein
MTDRYDRYADLFDNPVTAASIEVGNRVLHWQFMEHYQASTAREVVEGRARQAQALAAQQAEPEREAG